MNNDLLKKAYDKGPSYRKWKINHFIDIMCSVEYLYDDFTDHGIDVSWWLIPTYYYDILGIKWSPIEISKEQASRILVKENFIGKQ